MAREIEITEDDIAAMEKKLEEEGATMSPEDAGLLKALLAKAKSERGQARVSDVGWLVFQVDLPLLSRWKYLARIMVEEITPGLELIRNSGPGADYLPHHTFPEFGHVCAKPSAIRTAPALRPSANCTSTRARP